MSKSRKARLRQLINLEKAGNVRQFALSIGLTGAARIYNVLNDKNDLSEKLAFLITSKYKNYSTEWLLTGRGPMLREGSSTPDTPPATQTPAEPAAPDQTGFNKPTDSFSTASGHLDAEKLSLYILNHVEELEQQPIFMSYIKQKAYEIALDIVTEKLSK